MNRTVCAVTGDEVFHEVLPQGCALYVYRTPGLRGRQAVLSVDCGSLDTHAGTTQPTDGAASPQVMSMPPGIAHFLEHRLFEKPEGDLSARFAALGAEVDAHTTFTNTAFSFSCTDHFDESVALLLQLVFQPHFTDDGVLREREIVTREIQLFEDSLEWVSFHHALGALYGRHPLAMDIAGTEQSLGHIDRAALRGVYDRFYRPENTCIFVCGDVQPRQIRDHVAACLEGLVSGDSRWQGERLHFRSQPRPRSATSRVAVTMPLSAPRICLAFHDRGAIERGKALLKREICLDMAADVLFGPASDFFARQYAGGHIEAETFSCECYVETEFRFVVMTADVDDPERIEAAICEEIRRAMRDGAIEGDFERARRQAFGQLLYRYDEGEACIATLHSEVSRGTQPFGYFEALSEVGPDDVADCLESCFSAESGICTVWPEGSSRASAADAG